MREEYALIFGYNDYAKEIEKSIGYKYRYIEIFELDGDGENGFDLSDNWDSIDSRFDINNSVAFCVIDDMAKNIFLTISLRDAFKDLVIIALAQNRESADKLKLAGATKLLPTSQTTANAIYEILEKPIVTKVLHHILYEDGDLKTSEIIIENPTVFKKDYPISIDWGKEYNILVLFIISEDGINEFIYSSKIKHHKIEKGDTFIIVGYKKDIEHFRKLVSL